MLAWPVRVCVAGRIPRACGAQITQGVFGCFALVFRQRGKPFGFRARRAGLRCRFFLFGAAARFSCGFLFRRHPCQRGGLGNLFRAGGFGRQPGRVLLGSEAFLGQLRQVFFGPGPGP